VRLLLDTNALLWWEENSDRLGHAARATIRASESVYVSAASAWEAEIKKALGKLAFGGEVQDMIDANTFIELPVTVRHAAALRLLGRHPRDPFDRMLVAQALVEECTLVTADRHLARYGVPILDARA
jgi:PIN domain nuclease of toxin-antitoxin system